MWAISNIEESIYDEDVSKARIESESKFIYTKM